MSEISNINNTTTNNNNNGSTNPQQEPQQHSSNNDETSSSSEEKRPEDEGNNSASKFCEDVAKFDGRIVYNPDGSAYIIDGDDDDNASIHCQEGSIIEKRSGSETGDGEHNVYPQIAKAIYVHQNRTQQSYEEDTKSPLIHSYRVYSLRGSHEKNCNQEEDPEETLKKAGLGGAVTVPIKPILMCFICKLSFGFAKSFINHCSSDHALELREEERNILDIKNSSAIIQIVGKDKSPIVSFLEPDLKKEEDTKKRFCKEMDAPSSLSDPQRMLSPSAIKGILSAALSNAAAAAAAAAAASNGPTDGESPHPMEFPPHFPPSSFLDSLSPSVRNSLLEMNRQANNGRSSISPVTSNSLSCSPSPSLPQLPPGFGVPLTTNANMLQGTTIGACPDHVNGRPTGVECGKCDLILKASHMPGGLAWNAARNSCKTLKCPKCNWHYKYQETLDIHMKEKHPENETTCIYCITGQQHPRLARGETYTCGYKPYRCEVCNYSTTTKGNLSIHMQSDKHLNNMQELQNGGVVSTPDGNNKQIPSSVGGPLGGSPLIPKQKPSWRCDVCNYETNVARNLRIHMTSEKHTHNIMVLQQNVKQMQQLSGGGPPPPPPPHPLMFGPGGLPDPQMLQLQLASGIPPFNPDAKQQQQQQQPEAAMADLAYFQAVMMQMMTGGQFPPGPVPPEFSGSPNSPMNEEAMEPPPEPADPNPKYLYTCCVCREFGADNLELLSQHLTLDRTKTREHEVSLVIGGNYICKLCSYKTNLKANFQLHCKTDKHLQRLNHVNHIKEGGPSNEWRLKFLNVTNPVQLRCNACDYYTNSLHKLQLHTANQRHEISTVLFAHLKLSENGIPEERRSYSCSLCKFESPGKTGLMVHVRSIKHLQMEQIHQLQKKSEGNMSNTEIGEIFQVLETIPESSLEEVQERSESIRTLPSTSNPGNNTSNTSSFSTTGNSDESKGSDPDGRIQRQSPLHSSISNTTTTTSSSFNSTASTYNNNNNSSSISSSSNKEEKVYNPSKKQNPTPCPLCQEPFQEYSTLEAHVASIHSVNSEGLQRLLLLMEGSHWLNNNQNNRSSSSSSLIEEDSSKGMDTSEDKTDDLLIDDDSEKKGSSSSPSAISRKTDKGPNNYPLEKYLDPNRPYKCDVCKESFTQKNILLVHYNSVSHLHKLKRTMTGKPESLSALSSPNEPLPAGTALEAALGNIMNKQKDIDDEVKPFKCNICKVAYSQGSTLDIHIRSLLHQNRASKLQELALTGQIDLSKPLIEQPESSKISPLLADRKIIQDSSMSPKSLNSSGNSNQISSPNNINSAESPRSSPLTHIPPPFYNPPVSSSVQKSLNDLFLPKGGHVGNESFSSQQQQIAKLLQAFPGLASPNSSFNDEKSCGFSFASLSPDNNKKSSHVLKNLLQNYGFELVMQFNEYHQRRRLEEEERRRKKEAEEASSSRDRISKSDEESLPAPKRARKDDYNKSEPSTFISSNKKEYDEGAEQRSEETQKIPSSNALPELKKSICPICKKEFSSIWVLKAHSEEIHKDAVPSEFLEKFVEEFKSNLEKKDGDKVTPTSTASTSVTHLEKISPIKDQIPSSFLTPEKSMDEGFPSSTSGIHLPETSTPKSRSSTPSIAAPVDSDSLSHNNSNNNNNSMNSHNNNYGNSSTSSQHQNPIPTSTPDMQTVLQQAMLSSSTNSGINPMMLQMAQLQGMNPLIAMNLHPPLIPPAMLSNGNSGGEGGSPGVGSDRVNLLSQLQNSFPGMMDPHAHLLNQLGFDPKLIMKPGSDSSLLMDLKKQMPGGIDPKLLSMFVSSASKDGGTGASPFPPLPPNHLLNMRLDPKLMSNQPGPDPKLLLQLAQGLDPSKLLPGSVANASQIQSGLGSDQSLAMNSSKANTVFQQPEQQKRARTRITDEQLKVLRSNFDINNSPTEAATTKMSQQTGLPPKVIKHWFRNTLFKERQRNKDSPYNFNNPPSTMLNLEEYEKTGESKVTTLNVDEQKKYSPPCSERRISTGGELDDSSKPVNDEPRGSPALTTPLSTPSSTCTTPNSGSDILRVKKEEHLKKETDDVEAPPVSSSSLTLSNILGSQMNNSHPANFLTSPFSNFGGGGGGSGSGSNNSPLGGGSSGFPDFLNPLGNMMPDKSGSRSRSPSGGSSHNQGKRANRTRFTDYQIKVLQEFFENNAYPKDDDLEYLSKLLSLSPRVIVVWFQNARQKARKIYENQPPIDPTEDGAGRFTRTPGLNYQCKKCLLVFQRYYELIRHQKQHCFKEEDAKRSAQAQKAAAQAAAQFSGQSPNNFNVNNSTHSEDSNSSGGVAPLDRSCIESPMFNQSSLVSDNNHRSFDASEDWPGENNFSMFRGKEEEKKITPSMFDQLIREDPFSKFVNRQSSPSSNFSGGGGVGSGLFPNYPPVTSTPFGMSNRDRDSDDVDTESIDSSPSSSKRKLSEDGDFLDDKDEAGQPRDKRLRTTILPEQLDFLYQKYQVESNPSRKMLEQIANEVGLRKRVVQVWFQNTRARERKGQFRAHQQVINKRCPYCPALFKVRSALESHLATKHSDQYTRGEINIDALPDAEGGPPSIDEGDSRSILGHPLTPTSSISGGGPIGGGGSDLEVSMRKYYEDTMKRYMNDLQSNKRTPPLPNVSSSSSLHHTDVHVEASLPSSNHHSNSNQALDLTGPALDLSGGGPKSENADSWDEGSENQLDTNHSYDDVDGEEMSSLGDAQIFRNGDSSMAASKRFRTQMSSLQVKMMKSIFTFYKTPTMNECSELGRQIGLQKRVVQVWFQNARAKEKKARLLLQQATGVEPDSPPLPTECSVCNFKFTQQIMLQDHIFHKSHQDNVKIAITEGRYDPESPGYSLNQVLLSLSDGKQGLCEEKNDTPPPSGLNNSDPQNNTSPRISPSHISSKHSTSLPDNNNPGPHLPQSSVGNRDEMEKTLMQQLYGVGHGISSYPTGVATANPFLHPAMFSATGK
ncbi:zinc finger homeobox protein 3 [Lepeophtheirus salmonis]|uniref:zinc finger homeobox protein 3 n=1 Tax=Lepeophtheirus salmonis TaxID=72036 RepID=UPI001AE93152|nr:zinc finger homeobox protein 3-like [Lepeophtheirus salmonis]